MKRNTIIITNSAASIQQFLEEALSEDPAINENEEKEGEMSEEWKDDKEANQEHVQNKDCSFEYGLQN